MIETGGDRITDLHVWQVGPGHHAAIVAVATPEPRDPAFYKAKLDALHELSHVTVEVTVDRRHEVRWKSGRDKAPQSAPSSVRLILPEAFACPYCLPAAASWGLGDAFSRPDIGPALFARTPAPTDPDTARAAHRSQDNSAAPDRQDMDDDQGPTILN